MSHGRHRSHELTPELVIRAYAAGIFPMAERRDDPAVFWVDPRQRGILPLDRFHIPKRLRRTLRNGGFSVTVDQAFEAVIAACAKRPETWINHVIETAYTELHHKGLAHSIECWRDGKLIGGLYGIALGAAFFGESMFSSVRDASKIALVHLVARLRIGRFRLLDTQFITDHLRQFGADEIPCRRYLEKLEAAIGHRGVFSAALPDDQIVEEIERMIAGEEPDYSVA